jgi:hypothetical protein
MIRVQAPESLGAVVHEPHPRPMVDKACIVDVVRHLKAYGFLK